MDKGVISKQLSLLMKKKNSSQYAIVRAAIKGGYNLTTSQIRSVIKGEKSYTIDTLIAICRALDLEIKLTDNDNFEIEPLLAEALSTPKKKKAAVEVQNLTGNPPKTNYTINTLSKAEKLKGFRDGTIK